MFFYLIYEPVSKRLVFCHLFSDNAANPLILFLFFLEKKHVSSSFDEAFETKHQFWFVKLE